MPSTRMSRPGPPLPRPVARCRRLGRRVRRTAGVGRGHVGPVVWPRRQDRHRPRQRPPARRYRAGPHHRARGRTAAAPACSSARRIPRAVSLRVTENGYPTVPAVAKTHAAVMRGAVAAVYLAIHLQGDGLSVVRPARRLLTEAGVWRLPRLGRHVLWRPAGQLSQRVLAPVAKARSADRELWIRQSTPFCTLNQTRLVTSGWWAR
jgi:hypothetical protein